MTRGDFIGILDRFKDAAIARGWNIAEQRLLLEQRYKEAKEELDRALEEVFPGDIEKKTSSNRNDIILEMFGLVGLGKHRG